MNKENREKTIEIKFTINLDQANTPEEIKWEAGGSEIDGQQSSKAIMLSIWDPVKKNTVRFDLWTKEMMRNEMDILVFQSLLMTADAYAKASGNKSLADEILEFAEDFGIKAKLIKRVDKDEKKQFKLDI